MKSVWTNPSVVEFAKGQDPIDAIIDRAQNIVYNAIQAGWAGPPFDPYQLAELLKVKVIPYEDVADARTRHVGNGK
jgi:hypothetical protein